MPYAAELRKRVGIIRVRRSERNWLSCGMGGSVAAGHQVERLDHAVDPLAGYIGDPVLGVSSLGNPPALPGDS